MKLIMKHQVKHIKNGYSATSPEAGLTAHGVSEELARRNLEDSLRLFFGVFKRNHSLLDETRRAGLTIEDEENQEDLTVILV